MNSFPWPILCYSLTHGSQDNSVYVQKLLNFCFFFFSQFLALISISEVSEQDARGHGKMVPFLLPQRLLLSASANTRHFGTCLVVQGLRIHLPKQGMWVQSLLRELKSKSWGN